MPDELAGKRVVILGLARQGKAFAKFAARMGASVVVSDNRSEIQLSSVREELADLNLSMVFGGHPIDLLDEADVLVISGGVPADLPLVKEARRLGITVTNDSQEFLKRSPATIIGITGSAGKTTTTALTGTMVSESGRVSWIGGNIGRPLISDLEQISSDDIVVQELSSFQLELWSRSPRVAAVLNITPNHLDRHKTMASYSEAKANILRFQSGRDIGVLSADDPGSVDLMGLVRGRLRQFSLDRTISDGAFFKDGAVWIRDSAREEKVCEGSQIPLRGRHNIKNVLAAVVLADSVDTPVEAMREAIVKFKGVEHRLELVETIDGVQYINDSIATAPERAIAALESFDQPVILLAGGRDKDMVWEEWAAKVLQNARAVILFGQLAELMETYLSQAEVPQEAPQRDDFLIQRKNTLAEAVDCAARLAKPGDVVLLAPGGTSYDAYRDFAERGEHFREVVKDLAGLYGKKASTQVDFHKKSGK